MSNLSVLLYIGFRTFWVLDLVCPCMDLEMVQVLLKRCFFNYCKRSKHFAIMRTLRCLLKISFGIPVIIFRNLDLMIFFFKSIRVYYIKLSILSRSITLVGPFLLEPFFTDFYLSWIFLLKQKD